MDIDEFNRQQFARNFPPAQEWREVEGLLHQPLSSRQDALVSINGRDRTGAEVAIWMDAANAMYLMRMLASLQKDESLPVPSRPPGPRRQPS